MVVVRPDDKRDKKKRKRDNDPTRQTYKQLASQAGIYIHETNVEPESSFARAGVLGLNAEQEAHAVAAELGLRSSVDYGSLQPVYTPGTHKNAYTIMQSPYQSEVEDSSDSEEEDEIEATMMSSGDVGGVAAKRDKLHAMEAAEASALASRKSSVTSIASSQDDTDGDTSGLGRGGIMWTI